MLGMKKYDKISYPEDSPGLFADGSVCVQEKIDGSNGRFTLESNIEDEYSTEDRNLVFGSRKIDYKNRKDEADGFSNCIEYARSSVDINILRGYDQHYNGIVLFGEYMVPNMIREGYNWDKWKGKFIGFDVWSIGEECYLHPRDSVEIFDAIGLPYADILGEYTIEDWESGRTDYHNEDGEWMSNGDWCPTSGFGQGLAEGIVIKNPTTQTYAKMVREDFREKHNTGSMTDEVSDSHKLSYQYITDARIEKVARKLSKEGEYDSLSMNMMQDLPKEVIKDMAEEEGYNIFMYESWEVDFAEFRSLTSDRCSKVLRRIINIESSE